MDVLLPLTVAIPLLTAAVITGGDHVLPRRLQDLLGIVAAGAACALSLALMVHAEHHDAVHWFGGWHPRGHAAIGIDFAAGQLGTAMSALAAGLTCLALIYSFTYLRESSRHFDALMLIFCGGMCGLVLSGDIFNMFVWFELIGVAAFALAGFKVEELGPVQGAFNFAITNTVAAYLIVIGIGLLYGRTGALNLAQLGHALQGRGPDALVSVALTLIVVGFLVKAAAVPFHFWAADAHAVAPAPVCVLFSCVELQLGLFAIARVWWTVFEAPLGHSAVVGDALLWLGLGTALVGAVMSFLQRHLKRLLAYSTISTSGAMLAGIAMFGSKGLAGTANLVLSHALLKGGLFLGCGGLLLRMRTIDELKLHGRGRELPLLGVLFALGGIGLIGIPYVGIFLGHDQLDQEASLIGHHAVAPIVMVAAGTGAGAILRASARIFLGWGPKDDPLLSPEPEEEPSERQAALPLMHAVMVVMIAAGLAASVIPGLAHHSEHAAERFRDRAAYTAEVLGGRQPAERAQVPVDVPAPPLESVLYGIGAAAIALVTMLFGLYHSRLPRLVRSGGGLVGVPTVKALRAVHSGLIGDYITWLAVGTATLGMIWVLALR